MACCFDRAVTPSKTLNDAALARLCCWWIAHAAKARQAAGVSHGQAVACVALASVGRQVTLAAGGKTRDHGNTAECRRPPRRIRREAAEIRAATGRNRPSSSLAFQET